MTTLCARMAAACGCLAAASLVSVGASAEPGTFTPGCARLDLEAIDFIERHGETGDLPSSVLADAGLQFLTARIHCMKGEAKAGEELYRFVLNERTKLVGSRR